MSLAGYAQTLQTPIRLSVALLALRVVVGTAFVIHGAAKIREPFAWMGPLSTMPGWLQALAAIAEVGGGVAWLVGFAVPIASLGLLCTMSVALGRHLLIRHDPFVSPGGSSYELAATYLCVALLLLLAGPGRFSLDARLFR
jgi:putative oxidoreductase